MSALRWLLAVVLLLFASLAVAAPHPADIVLGRLAAAFERRDVDAIRNDVADGWSGLRFSSSWDDAQWKAAGRALRDAKLETATPDRRVYRVTLRA